MKVVNDVDAVERYYDEWTDRYLEVYGEVIQAFRSADDNDTLGRIANSIGFAKGDLVLDAGCGVGGPARYFAKNHGVTIEGVSISQYQVDTAKEKNLAAGLDGQVKIKKADFHFLTDYFHRGRFDKVLFLESLGHSKEPEKVLKGAYQMLKPGGHIYIKDFYSKESNNPEFQAYIDRLVNNINIAYSYNTLDLNVVLKALRRAGFEIEFIRPVPIQHDIQVRADFESKFGIDLFEGGLDFPYADWLEIKCWKPTYEFKNQRQFADDTLQADYNQNGYATTPLLSASEVAKLTDWYQHHRPENQGEFEVTLEATDLDYRKQVSTLLKEVVGPKLKILMPRYKAIFGSFVVKPMGDGGILPLHSDWQYTDENKNPSFGVWIPLVPVDKENGGLLMVQGSHKHVNLFRGQNTQNSYEFIKPVLKAERVVALAQAAGEACVFDHRTIHGSGENYTLSPRLAIAITMVPEDEDIVHYYRHPSQPIDEVTKYIVPESFFLDYDITQPPNDTYKVAEVKDNNIDSTAHALVQEYGGGSGPLFDDAIKQSPIARRRVMVADADQRAIDEDGYLIKPFLDTGEVALLKSLFNAETAGLDLPMAPTTWSKNEAYRDKIYGEIKAMFLPKLSQLLADYKPISGAFIIKNPSPNSALQTHFDWLFVDERRNTAVHVWVPLVDVDATNGCYHIIPQSHRLVTAWRGQNTPDSEFFNGRQFKPGVQKALPMKAGDALIYDMRLIHGTPPNLGSEPRLAAGIVMLPADAKPIHVYTPYEKMYDKDVEVYEVDEDFYKNHDIKARPVGYPYLGKVIDNRREDMFRLMDELYLVPKEGSDTNRQVNEDEGTQTQTSLLDKIKKKVWG